ncbi:hypothetical protein R9C00_23965 [Flammeovirgaceae bacterium SG7u.111]|nr:hypothetical protein [Flammeovirgaceae bacterium SG7u.132]WPO34759.1 hypothetical protein R9C00_23965 [Flammeovirgaceae bacterium SG7u.111]
MKSEYIFQSLLIFASVFLGIMASNWNDDFKQKRKTKQFLESLTAELESNHAKIEKRLTYHIELGEVADSVMDSMSKEELQLPISASPSFADSGFSTIPKWQGLGISPIETAVYESGVTSGVFEHLPIDLLTKISTVNSMQNEYIRFGQILSEKLLNYNSDTKTIEFFIIMKILGGDQVHLEKAMVSNYEKLISELKKRDK